METTIYTKEIKNTKEALNFLLNFSRLQGITLEKLAIKIKRTPAYIYNLKRKKDLVFEELSEIAEALELEATINLKNKE